MSKHPSNATVTKTTDDRKNETTNMRWESMYELGICLATMDPANSIYTRPEVMSHLDGTASGSWGNGHTCASIADALRACPDTYVERVAKIRRRIENDLDIPVAPVGRRMRTRMEDGEELDPIAYTNRDPFGWTGIVRERVQPRPLRIGVNVAISSSEGVQELAYRGAAACAIADIYQSRGIPCEVVCFDAVCAHNMDDRGARMVLEVVLKRASEPANLSELSFTVCEPAVIRLAFIALEWLHCEGRFSGGYGRIESLKPSERAGFDVIVDRGVKNADAATKCVRAAMAKAAESLGLAEPAMAG